MNLFNMTLAVVVALAAAAPQAGTAAETQPRAPASGTAESPADAPPSSAAEVVTGDDAIGVGDALEEGSEAQVVVRVSAGERMRRSAEAVKVIALDELAVRASDMGAALERTEGVDVRTAGGLGADASLALNGLQGEQVRLLVDGVPLELAGFGRDLGSIPVGLVDRVEIYKGVVPLRLGADALGGAVNLVTGARHRSRFAHASYEAGSFGTHRIAAQARESFAAGRVFTGGRAFFDRARNDYPIDVTTARGDGSEARATVRRFHDAYAASGGALEAGLVGVPWADRLELRAHGAVTSKQIQHNPLMTRAYGEPGSGARTLGATLRWDKGRLLGDRLELDLLLSASLRRLTLRDDAAFTYDWFGARVRERPTRGEIGDPTDARIDERAIFARLGARLWLSPWQALEVSVSPQATRRRGDDRLDEGGFDLLNLPQRRALATSGVGWTGQLAGGVVEGTLFGKSYLFEVEASEVVQVGLGRGRRTAVDWGWGGGVRVALGEALLVKAPYERALRLPTAVESFGDGGLTIASNPTLAPERSHNANASLIWDRTHERWGRAVVELTGFVRATRDQITLTPTPLVSIHENLLGARAAGVEGSLSWRSPSERIGVHGSGAYTDLRNTSSRGPYAAYAGDRVPNRPHLTGFLELRLQQTAVFAARDLVSIYGHLRYVHEFFRSWESLGARGTKRTIPTQLVPTLGLTYRLGAAFAANFEAQNVANARTFDVVGVQRPGRSFFLKLTGTFDDLHIGKRKG